MIEIRYFLITSLITLVVVCVGVAIMKLSYNHSVLLPPVFMFVSYVIGVFVVYS